jgi:transcriptional regulator with XRE-family HTH domain
LTIGCQNNIWLNVAFILLRMGRKPKTRRNSYGAWLLLLRKEKGLSQEAVAKQSGIPRTTLMYWERSGNITGRRQILKLAKIYGVPVQKLLRAEKSRQD